MKNTGQVISLQQQKQIDFERDIVPKGKCEGTANPTWGDIFESSKLKARTSLLPRFSEKRRSSFEL